MVYKIGVPPFTASSDFDYFLEFYATRRTFNELELQFRAPAAKVGKKNIAEALKSFSRRKAMLEFRADDRYGDPLFRMRRCVIVFGSSIQDRRPASRTCQGPPRAEATATGRSANNNRFIDAARDEGPSQLVDRGGCGRRK